MDRANELHPEALLERADNLPDCGEKVALLEQAVRLSDARGEDMQAFSSRMELASAAGVLGWTDKVIVAFSWCVNRFEQQPQRFAQFEWRLTWTFPYVIECLMEYSRVPLQQVHQMLDRMESYFRRRSHSMRTVLVQRSLTAARSGDVASAAEFFARARREPSDEFSDPPVWENVHEVELLVAQGEFERAAPLARLVLEMDHWDVSIWKRAASLILRPLTLLGRKEEALALHARARRFLNGMDINPLDTCAHLAFLSQVGRLTEALQHFERHMDLALKMPDDETHFRFYAAGWRLLESLPPQPTVRKLRLPTSFPLHSPHDAYETARLVKWFQDRTEEVAARFDARNGNDHYSTKFVKYYHWCRD